MRKVLIARWLTVALALPVLGAPPPATPIERRYAQARKHPPDLYALLLKMPKGGDLHLHWTGAIYAESFLRVAAEESLCINLQTHAIVAPPPSGSCSEIGADASKALTDNTLRNAMIDSLSMRNFVPGLESAHDHFFAVFAKFGSFKSEHRGELLGEVVRRAAEQNESYLEVMALSGNAANQLGTETARSGDFASDRENLMAAGLEKLVDGLSSTVDELDRGRLKALGCEAHPDSPPCRVTVRYLYQVTRES